MGDYKIGQIFLLKEDTARIADDNISVETKVIQQNTSPQPANNSTSNQTTSSIVPDSTSINTTANGQTSTGSSNELKVQPVGANGEAGPVAVKTSIDSKSLPNIYFNIRKNSFSDQGLYFRFKTSDIAGAAGDTTNTWSSNSSLLSGLSLTGDSGCLKVTEAYGQKFYELLPTKSISKSGFSFNLPRNPTYAFLVYALANTSITKTLYKDSNQVHKFQASSDATNTIYNNSYTAESGARFGGGPEQNYSVFSLSPLLSKQFISEYQQRNGLETINIDSLYFSDSFSQWSKNTIVASGTNNINQPPQFISNKIFNLCNTPNSLTSPKASNTPFIINQGSNISLSTFSLFFVEMYSYITLPQLDQQNANYNILNVFTRINGSPSYNTKILIKPDIDFSQTISCNISIGNNPATNGVKMFLFDYLYGTSRDVLSLNQDRNLILESLAYNNRNVLLKSSTDLQMTNATSSLGFPAFLSHPFLNMYFS